MRHFCNTVTAAAAATALLLAPTAHASSLSSSSGIVAPAPVDPAPVDPDPTDPDPEDPADRPGEAVVSVVEEALVAAGHVLDPQLTAAAQRVADEWEEGWDINTVNELVDEAGYQVGYSQLGYRAYFAPDPRHHISRWEEGHEDLEQIKFRDVGVAHSAEADEDGNHRLVIIHAGEPLTPAAE